MNEEGYMMDDVTFFDYTKTLLLEGLDRLVML
jgi:hypothetical protein